MGARQPFLFFTSHHGELADAVREGRRNEFAEFAEFADEATRERIPDPNAVSTFENSRPDFSARQEPGHAEWYALYRELLSIRQREIVPRLQVRTFSNPCAGASGALRWQLGDGSRLRLELNRAPRPHPFRRHRSAASCCSPAARPRMRMTSWHLVWRAVSGESHMSDEA